MPLSLRYTSRYTAFSTTVPDEGLMDSAEILLFMVSSAAWAVSLLAVSPYDYHQQCQAFGKDFARSNVHETSIL